MGGPLRARSTISYNCFVPEYCIPSAGAPNHSLHYKQQFAIQNHTPGGGFLKKKKTAE